MLRLRSQVAFGSDPKKLKTLSISHNLLICLFVLNKTDSFSANSDNQQTHSDLVTLWKHQSLNVSGTKILRKNKNSRGNTV